MKDRKKREITFYQYFISYKYVSVCFQSGLIYLKLLTMTFDKFKYW